MANSNTPTIALFPGQGAQYVGMEKLLGDEGLRLLGQAREILGYPLDTLVTKGPEEELTQTQNAQPAIFTISAALWKKFQGLGPACVLGHSVGEYGALYGAGCFSFEHGLKAVHQRGLFMQKAVRPGTGGMLAVLTGPEGLPKDLVAQGLDHVNREYGQVAVANDNAPGQVVFSGEATGLSALAHWLKENFPSPHKSIPLKVSAPFHSPLMNPAADQMRDYLHSIKDHIHPNKIPYVANVNAQYYREGTSSRVIIDNLVGQIPRAVQWSQSIQNVLARWPGPRFCEVGPGKVLQGLGRKIHPHLKEAFL